MDEISKGLLKWSNRSEVLRSVDGVHSVFGREYTECWGGVGQARGGGEKDSGIKLIDEGGSAGGGGGGLELGRNQ